jgi:hypothetical protein
MSVRPRRPSAPPETEKLSGAVRKLKYDFTPKLRGLGQRVDRHCYERRRESSGGCRSLTKADIF